MKEFEGLKKLDNKDTPTAVVLTKYDKVDPAVESQVHHFVAQQTFPITVYSFSTSTSPQQEQSLRDMANWCVQHSVPVETVE